MSVLEWMGRHPILTVIVLCMVLHFIAGTVEYIGGKRG